MTSKQARQREVLRIIADRAVATQDGLARLLARRGHAVNQTTLSRDLRELGLVKMALPGGGSRYVPVDGVPASSLPATQVVRLLRSAAHSRNLVLLKTAPGNGSALGAAVDRLGWKELIGSVAGDDTLLVVVDENQSAKRVARRFKEMIS